MGGFLLTKPVGDLGIDEAPQEDPECLDLLIGESEVGHDLSSTVGGVDLRVLEFPKGPIFPRLVHLDGVAKEELQ